MNLFVFDDLIYFVDQLSFLTNDPIIKSCIWATSAYISIESNKDKIKNIFCQWITENLYKISTRDESLFQINNTKGDISEIINQISNVWELLPVCEKEIIWEWMEHFARSTITN